MDFVSKHRVAVTVGIAIAAGLFLSKGAENYYGIAAQRSRDRNRIRALESGFRAILDEAQMPPISKPTDDIFPVSRFNPPRIQGRRT